MTPVLKTQRMTLRRFTWSDLDLLVGLNNDPAVMRFLNDGRPVGRTEVANELATWLADYECTNSFGFWAATQTDRGEFLGWFHFRPGAGSTDLEPELGFRLRRGVWGQGLATEGSRAIIDRGFFELPIERVYAHTMSVHAASRRVLEKAGLRFVRTFATAWPIPISGDDYGDVEYELTRHQWDADRHRREPHK